MGEKFLSPQPASSRYTAIHGCSHQTGLMPICSPQLAAMCPTSGDLFPLLTLYLLYYSYLPIRSSSVFF